MQIEEDTEERSRELIDTSMEKDPETRMEEGRLRGCSGRRPRKGMRQRTEKKRKKFSKSKLKKYYLSLSAMKESSSTASMYSSKVLFE